MASPAPPNTTGFVVGVFVLGTLVGVVVLALGLTGGLGGPIPGTHPGNGISTPPSPASCEGKDQKGNFTFDFVGGIGGTLTFNGTHPGPCVALVVGTQVTVKFSVAADAGTTHTWVLVNASNASAAVNTPAFPGAGFTGADRFMGIGPGASMVFHFNATVVGAYQYICEMSGHYAGGMWGWFNVTATPAAAAALPGIANAVAIGSPTIARSD
ncbi:MAG TPA: hypothetical protein VJQ43_03085 [Thermoplasmata archaeon]|nr:hypothetical protein [Thermoplasmata archaeon]